MLRCIHHVLERGGGTQRWDLLAERGKSIIFSTLTLDSSLELPRFLPEIFGYLYSFFSLA